MKEINEILDKLKDTKISYSVGTYSLAIMVNKGLIDVDELVDYINKVEEQIVDEYKTEMKSEEQLDDLKKLFPKEVFKIECVFVDSIKEYMIGVVFKDQTYITLKAYEDVEKIKNQISKIKKG